MEDVLVDSANLVAAQSFNVVPPEGGVGAAMPTRRASWLDACADARFPLRGSRR